MISEAEQTPRLGVARNKVREKGKKIENNNFFQTRKKKKTNKKTCLAIDYIAD